MKVLVGCEFSGAVRDAFIRLGHEAWSCDLETVQPEGEYVNYHLYGDVRQFLDGSRGPTREWNMLLAFPPCTYLCSSGARWLYDSRFPNRKQQRLEAIEFVRELMSCNIPRICIENPIGCLSTQIRKPDQKIQPWQFGHPEVKTTCLWLKNLPLLVPTNQVEVPFDIMRGGYRSNIHYAPPAKERAKKRSLTYKGIAEAMANQWGGLS